MFLSLHKYAVWLMKVTWSSCLTFKEGVIAKWFCNSGKFLHLLESASVVLQRSPSIICFQEGICHALSENESLDPLIWAGDTLQFQHINRWYTSAHHGGVCSDVTRWFLNYGTITLTSCWQCHSGKLTSAVVTVKCRLASYKLWNLEQVANISKCPFSEYNPASCRVMMRTEWYTRHLAMPGT